MTLRICFSLLLLLSGTSALAHDGDHTGMTDVALQLHHLGLPVAITAIALIIITSYRKRAAQLAADDGADRR